MHFSVPETEECFEQPETQKGQYTVYKVHVNGVHHCSVRYSSLYSLHNQLKQDFGPSIPDKLFPPKRMLALTDLQVEDRRVQLEKYLQALSQDAVVANSTLLNDFLIKAQKEVQLYCEEVKLKVFLVNGKSIEIDIFSSDETDEVLEAVIKAIGVQEDLTYYFGLFLLEETEPGSLRIVRKLQDFESPFISLNRCRHPDKSRIQVRKTYWSPKLDAEVCKDSMGLNLIYTEAMQAIKKGQWDCPSPQKEQLAKFKEQGKRAEFLEVARKLAWYGHIIFDDCEVDLPVPSECIVGVGPRCLVIRDKKTKKDAVYGITRIRCWKIAGSLDGVLKLSFDYLRARDDLVWITITCTTSIFMSMCMQSVVDELVRLNKGERLRRPKDRVRKPRPTPKPKPQELIAEEQKRREQVAAEDAARALDPPKPKAAAAPATSAAPAAADAADAATPSPAPAPAPAAKASAGVQSSSTRDQSTLSRASSVSSQRSDAPAASPSRKSFFGGSKSKSSAAAKPTPKAAAGLNFAFSEEDLEEESNAGFGGIGDDDL